MEIEQLCQCSKVSYSRKPPGDICTDPKAVIYIFRHSLSHTCTHRDGPKYTYLQRISDVEVCFHCSVWRRQREDPCSIWTWHIQCIYLATLHYLKYLICCTLSFSPNGYFYVKCTFLTIMSYNLVAKDNFLPHVTEYLSFKLNEVSDHSPIMWKCT